MKQVFLPLMALTAGTLFAADEVSTFKAYVDSDLCARLMLGQIDAARIDCSKKTHKNGSEAVLVRLSNNVVLDVNKTKMIDKMVGDLAQVSGQLKVKDGTIKLSEVQPIQASDIPAGDPARKLLDPVPVTSNPQLFEKVRHELAMLPYLSDFDFISFALQGNSVILTGWTVRSINRDDAQSAVRNVEGVESLVNNIEVLELGSFDMQIRASARAALQQNLGRYFWGSGSDIKIVVKNGDIILLGTVANDGDKDIAGIKCNTVPGAFHVFNLLRVQSSEKKG